LSAEITVREASAGDRANLKGVIDASFPRFYRFFASESVDSDGGVVLVSEVQGKVVGFARLTEFQIGDGKFSCILWIAVHPDFRRRGIALKLTQTAVQCLKSRGATAVFASAQRRNTASLANLEKAGFVRMGFLGLRRIFGWRLFSFYGDIWYAPYELVLMHR
jgi:ribosomal protein S18 acetylase RimI-like enzyme